MTNSSDENAESDLKGVSDDQLPEDLVPDDEENPLAGGLDAGETAGDLGPGELLEEGKSADQEPTDRSAETSDDASDD